MAATRVTDDERITAYGLLLEAQRHLHRMFELSLRSQVGISIAWYEALLRLARSPEQRMPITELGEAMVLTSGGATRLVDRLEEGGYVRRVACPTDRRVSWAQLTEEGLETVTQATAVHLVDLEEHFASQLTAGEIAVLTDLLARLRRSG